MARKKSLEVQLDEAKKALAEVQMEIAVARTMYSDMLEKGVSDKALAKAEEVIREWQSEARILQDEISAIHKSLAG